MFGLMDRYRHKIQNIVYTANKHLYISSKILNFGIVFLEDSLDSSAEFSSLVFFVSRASILLSESECEHQVYIQCSVLSLQTSMMSPLRLFYFCNAPACLFIFLNLHRSNGARIMYISENQISFFKFVLKVMLF